MEAFSGFYRFSGNDDLFRVMKKIALVHLGSFGDCLYATAIARQIKTDYPDCYLTWIIGEKYSSVLINNPYVDEIEKYPNPDYYFEGWNLLKEKCLKLKNEGFYDEVFFSQIYPENLHTFDGTIRNSTFKGYPGNISDVTPVLFLTEEEVTNVKKFLNKVNPDKKRIVVFEFAANSNQTFINKQFAVEAAHRIVNNISDYIVILTSHQKIETGNPNIIDGSSLTFRENAELVNNAWLFIGCSSGITWLSTSGWGKQVPTIQLINPKAYWFAGVLYDHEYFGIDNKHIIEMQQCTTDYLLNCLVEIYNNNFELAKNKYSQTVLPARFKAFRILHFRFLTRFQLTKTRSLYKSYVQRHGFRYVFGIFIVVNFVLLPLAPFWYLKNNLLKMLRK